MADVQGTSRWRTLAILLAAFLANSGWPYDGALEPVALDVPIESACHDNDGNGIPGGDCDNRTNWPLPTFCSSFWYSTEPCTPLPGILSCRCRVVYNDPGYCYCHGREIDPDWPIEPFDPVGPVGPPAVVSCGEPTWTVAMIEADPRELACGQTDTNGIPGGDCGNLDNWPNPTDCRPGTNACYALPGYRNCRCKHPYRQPWACYCHAYECYDPQHTPPWRWCGGAAWHLVFPTLREAIKVR